MNNKEDFLIKTLALIIKEEDNTVKDCACDAPNECCCSKNIALRALIIIGVDHIKINTEDVSYNLQGE